MDLLLLLLLLPLFLCPPPPEAVLASPRCLHLPRSPLPPLLAQVQGAVARAREGGVCRSRGATTPHQVQGVWKGEVWDSRGEVMLLGGVLEVDTRVPGFLALHLATGTLVVVFHEGAQFVYWIQREGVSKVHLHSLGWDMRLSRNVTPNPMFTEKGKLDLLALPPSPSFPPPSWLTISRYLVADSDFLHHMSQVRKGCSPNPPPEETSVLEGARAGV